MHGRLVNPSEEKKVFDSLGCILNPDCALACITAPGVDNPDCKLQDVKVNSCGSGVTLGVVSP
jgi:hypothetical protein